MFVSFSQMPSQICLKTLKTRELAADTNLRTHHLLIYLIPTYAQFHHIDLTEMNRESIFSTQVVSFSRDSDYVIVFKDLGSSNAKKKKIQAFSRREQKHMIKLKEGLSLLRRNLSEIRKDKGIVSQVPTPGNS